MISSENFSNYFNNSKGMFSIDQQMTRVNREEFAGPVSWEKCIEIMFFSYNIWLRQIDQL